MEQTLALTRMSKALCWFQIVVSAVGTVFFLGLLVFVIRRMTLVQYTAGAAVPWFGIPFPTLVVTLMVFSIRSSWRELRFKVVLSDEAVRIGDVAVPWQSVSRVFGFYSLRMAFILRTKDMGRFMVPRVEQADLLEDLIRARVIDGAIADETGPGSHLVRYDVSGAVRARFQCASVLFWCVAIAGFGTAFRTTTELVRLPAVLAVVTFTCLASWAWSRAHFSVAVFENAIRVGDSIARWDEIEGIQTRARRVAFRVRTRDGKKLNVYAGLENGGQLEQMIRDRLVSPGE